MELFHDLFGHMMKSVIRRMLKEKYNKYFLMKCLLILLNH